MKRPLLIAFAIAPPVTAMAQVPTAVLRSGAPIPGISTHEFTGIDWLGTNHQGGLVANINGSNAGQFDDFLWGSVGGGTVGELRSTGLQGSVNVTSFSRECSGSGARHTYIGNVPGMGESLMVDDTIIATVGGTNAPGGGTWVRFDEPFLDTAGEVWFRGQYTSPTGTKLSLIKGASLTPVLEANQVVAGLPSGVNSVGGPEDGYDVTYDGSHWMGVVVSANSRRGVVRTDRVLTTGGVPLVTGNFLPPNLMPVPNERFTGFEQVQVAPDDRWAVIAGTPTGMIVRDGDLFVRNQQIVDGFLFTGQVRAIAMDKWGRLAWIGRIEVSSGVFRDGLFREKDLLYVEGDDVDIDFDGVPDPGWTISDIIGGVGRLAFTEDGTIWATVRMTTPMGGLPFAVIGVGDPFGRPYCTSEVNSSGFPAEIQAVGTPVIASNELRIRCVQMPLNTFGLFLCSPSQGFVMNAGGSQGDLCLSGSIGRFNASLGNSGATGSIELLVDLNAIPQPNGAVAATVGQSWNFQCWFRDANPIATSNFSNGIEVTLL